MFNEGTLLVEFILLLFCLEEDGFMSVIVRYCANLQ